MVYRLCVCVDENKKKSAFAVYNQQDFCVYKRVVDMLEEDSEREYVRVCEAALAYFKKNMRSRYYTEHFSELLDEDRGVVLCTMPALVRAFVEYREANEPIPERFAILKEQFDIWSVSFIDGRGDALIDRTRLLLFL